MLNTTCSVPQCDRTLKAGGLCSAHLQRVRRKGDVQAHIPLRGTASTAETLWCSSCEASKAREDFHRNRAAKSGHDGVCKACVTARRKAQSAHRKDVRDAWRGLNRDSVLEAKRRSYHRNPKRSLEAGRAWRKANAERVRLQIKAQNLARYARNKEAPGRATTADVAARWAYYGGKCWMCGAIATDTDHVKPLAKGGSNWPANLRPACRRCNRAKSDTWPLEVTHGDAPLRGKGPARP